MEFFIQLEFNPNLVCAVCRDIIETAVQPPCGHVFCLDCLLAWTDYISNPTKYRILARRNSIMYLFLL